MWKHSKTLDSQSSKTTGAADCVWFTVQKVTLLHKHRCLFISPLYQTTSILHPARHPSCLQAIQGDPSLLVCAVQDSWTSSFLYKSPSGARQRRLRPHYGWSRALSTPFGLRIYLLTLHWNRCPAELVCLHRRSSDQVKWRPLRFHERLRSASSLCLCWRNCKLWDFVFGRSGTLEKWCLQVCIYVSIVFNRQCLPL